MLGCSNETSTCKNHSKRGLEVQDNYYSFKEITNRTWKYVPGSEGWEG